MSLRRWMLRAMQAERRARLAERRARLAEMLAVAAMGRLSDSDLLAVRDEMGGNADGNDAGCAG
jgi:hypothetical protein